MLQKENNFCRILLSRGRAKLKDDFDMLYPAHSEFQNEV